MHELGIIVHVMRTVEEVAAENNLTEIRSVTCEIGEVSGVVPEYMADCWGYARSRSELLKDSELKIEIIPGVTMCEDCGKLFHSPVCKNMSALWKQCHVSSGRKRIQHQGD